jgi:predicted phage terminase large subunit-like protein
MALSRDEKKVLARSSPAGFAWYASGERWVPADHLMLLSQKLVDAAAGRIKRLMVFMPPRHGKSELISKYTPAWYLGRFPDRQVMLASYSDQFAASWGRKARDEFKEHGPSLFGVRVNPETAGGGQWHVLGRDGVMVTAGVGGGLTGKGAHLLIIDDPVKNSQDAASEVIQQAQIDWWKSTARTRLMPGGSVVLVMTRWHEADLAGRLIADWQAEGGDEWEIISLPGIAEERCSVSYPPAKMLDVGADALGRGPGEALWPKKLHAGNLVGFDLEDLEQTRRAMGGHWFNAMYQQRPSAAEGNLFQKKHFRYYEREAGGLIRIFRENGTEVFDPDHSVLKFCTVDAAESEKKSADFTVVATWLVTPSRDLLLWNRERVKFEGPEVKSLIRRVNFAERPSIICVEKASAGTGILQELVREGLPLIALHPDTDKITRALPMVARYEEHRVFHPRGIGFEWVQEEWEPELLNFPNALNDDQVDVAAYAGLQLPLLGGHGALRGGAVSQTRSGRAGTLTGGLLSQNL